MNKLNKLYKLILECLLCKIKDDYQVVMVHGVKEYEIKIDEKKMYLPTTDAMNSFDTDRVYFHPACESITSKETEVDKVLRKLITSSIYFSFKPVAAVLTKVANKPNNKTISGKMLEQLAPMKGISKDVEREVIDLIARISMQTEYEGVDTRIINYTLMRGGKTENDEHIYYRCIPSFPFYNEVTRVINQNSGAKDNGTVIFNDSNYKLQTLKIVQSLFEIAIPTVTNVSRGEAQALNPIAARMTAMLRCFGLIAGDINMLVSKFRKEFDGIGMYGIETGWVEQLDDLSEIALLVPPLDYNNYNTAGKTQDGTQDQNFNLFNVLSERGITQQGYQQQPVPQQQQQQQGAPAVPPARDNEVYIGMSSLSNGLYEFRFQNGPTVRVVCVRSDGHVMTETYVPAGNQQQQFGYNQNGWGQPQWNQPGFQQPVFNNGTVPFSGGVILPNGVIVPNLSQINPWGNDPYQQQPQPQQDYFQSNTTTMMDGSTNSNWQ